MAGLGGRRQGETVSDWVGWGGDIVIEADRDEIQMSQGIREEFSVISGISGQRANRFRCI